MAEIGFRNSLWQINKHFVAFKFYFKISHKTFKNHLNKMEKRNPQKINEKKINKGFQIQISHMS